MPGSDPKLAARIRSKRSNAGWRRRLRAGIALPGRLRSYGYLHAQAFVASVGKLRRAPLAALMTVMVIGIALALPAGLYALVQNFKTISGDLEFSNQISLFLKVDIDDTEGREFAERLRNHRKVQSVLLISKEDALKEFQAYSGYGKVLEILQTNPLPVVVQVQPNAFFAQTDRDLQGLVAELQALPEVDLAQVDMQWVKRLHAILEMAERLLILVAAILSLAVLLTVGNTIRLEIQNRREEIAVTDLLGATRGFIRRPFLYSGFWYGFLGGMLAWLLVVMMLWLLDTPVRTLSSLYQGQFELRHPGREVTLLLLVSSTGLGILGAFLVVNRHLRRLEPR